jgi:hypothetical protein
MRGKTLLALILGSAATAMLSLPASAQAIRTWVAGSSIGDDVNPCSRFQPCRTFAGALSKTAINGEINCIEAGGYGTVLITKSVTIDCNETTASILAGLGTGIIINIAPNANDPHRSVRLRGLTINGTGTVGGTIGTRTGTDGIRIIEASSVFVEDTTIGEFTQSGIEVAADAATNLTLDNVVIRNTNVAGVTIASSGGQAVASFNNVRIDGTSVGVSAANNVRASLRNLVLVHATTGIQASGGNNIVNVENMLVSFAATGIQSSATNIIRVSNSVVTQNTTGLNSNGGSLISMSGNSVTGNTTNGTFTSTVAKQ